MRRSWTKVAGWIVLALAALFFVWNGSEKLAGSEEMTAMFRALGYPDWMRLAVGAAEIAGGICLLIPSMTLWAAAFLGCLMLGASFSELRAGHTFEALIPAQWLVLFSLVVWFKRPRRARGKVRA